MRFLITLFLILGLGWGFSYWRSHQGINKYSLIKPREWLVAGFQIPNNPSKEGFYFVSPVKRPDFIQCELNNFSRECLALANLRLIVDKDVLAGNLNVEYYFQTVSEEMRKNDKIRRVEKLLVGPAEKLEAVVSRVKGPEWMNYQSVYVPLPEFAALLLFTTNDFSVNPDSDAIRLSPLVKLVLEKWL